MDTERVKVQGLILEHNELRFECQYCKELVEQVGGANVVWDHEHTEGFVVHKACDPRRQGRLDRSQELDVELVWLLSNTGMDDKRLARARETAQSLSEI